MAIPSHALFYRGCMDSLNVTLSEPALVVWWLVNVAVSEMSILRMRACGTLCLSKIHICSMQLSVYKGTICTFFPIILGLAFSGLIMILPLPVYLPTV